MRAGSRSGSFFGRRRASSGCCAGWVGLAASCNKSLPHQFLNNDAGRIHVCIRLTERRNDAVAASLRRTKIYKQHLIFLVVDELTQSFAATDQVCRRELAFEDRILQVIPETAHGLEHLLQAFLIADVVTDEIGSAHPFRSP